MAGVLDEALSVPSNIIDGVTGEAGIRASQELNDWSSKQITNILGAMGIADPIAASNQAEAALSNGDLSSISSGVVADSIQQRVVQQITQQVLGQSGQSVQAQQVQAAAQASKGISTAAVKGKEIPITQKKLDALLEQNAQMSRILQVQTQVQQQNTQQSAATAHGINQINERNSEADLAELRSQEAIADEMLNNSAFGIGLW
ncbi:hypothetical protein [Lyngbya confervoides]|uniref:Uncharacterized protein n=1 Tax=Lyngbya confervoides BDU141951 TaxID=1574623 RepID=A0ABD4T173_9CYAN|nr:hypothetical protein [Lyngbya confervoides]MCM1982151.1 hypothetical protein [Lyngbya confervoides BDU141951]